MESSGRISKNLNDKRHKSAQDWPVEYANAGKHKKHYSDRSRHGHHQSSTFQY